MSDANSYTMKIGLNVLNHLGINLYSNVPAVLSEVVANSWDADAENVKVTIDNKRHCITIYDDGHGMTKDDINDKFLYVGYERRKHKDERVTPKHGRDVMGRKGIGKLSIFSVADVVEVHTVRDRQKSGFLMKVDDIKNSIKRNESEYHPAALDEKEVTIDRGTLIKISRLRKDLSRTEAGLKKRLARRFSIIGTKYKFNISVNGSMVQISDRDYFHKIQYIWVYDHKQFSYASYCKYLDKSDKRSGKLAGTKYNIHGWIGSVKGAGDLKDGDENLNKIVVMVRGKLAKEDILEEFSEGGIYSKYLIGEINADFLDVDDKADIATSSRQDIKRDDERYLQLRAFLAKELKYIQSSWTDLRNLGGKKEAMKIPEIEEWFEGLKGDTKRRAERLFGKINLITVDSEDEKKSLLKHSILAFESLRYKENLDALERISPENLASLSEIFTDLDDIEAVLYHQIVTERLLVIEALDKKVGSLHFIVDFMHDEMPLLS